MELASWLKDAGAKGLDDLDLADFPSTGRGVRTKRPFKKGEKILTIASDSLWTVKRAHADKLVGMTLQSASLSVEDTFALYILFIRSRESGYEGLRSHVAALPSIYSSSIFFTDDELQVCAGSSLYAITKQLEIQIEETYRDLVIRVIGPHGDLFPLSKFTIEDYKWALCTIWSRGMDFSLSAGNSFRLLAPFADMLNHSPESQQCHAYDPSSESLVIYAGKDYQVGDQLFIYYGPVPNNRLLRLYGFVMPDNPYDSYDLVLTTHHRAPFYKQKQRFWAACGLDTTSTISLTLTDPLPKDVLTYLRIQRCDETDLATAALQQIEGKPGKISDSNETQVLESLIVSFASLLDNFSIPLEKIEAQISRGVYDPGSNSWAAAIASLGEQRVLRLAKERAENLLSVVESGGDDSARCANCQTSSGKLMLCARCKGVKYCGRPCQVAHFKEHKTSCRAASLIVK